LRQGFSPQEVLEVIRRQGRVPVKDYVRLRVRYFVDGVVMGSLGPFDSRAATITKFSAQPRKPDKSRPGPG